MKFILTCLFAVLSINLFAYSDSSNNLISHEISSKPGSKTDQELSEQCKSELKKKFKERLHGKGLYYLSIKESHFHDDQGKRNCICRANVFI